MGLVLGTNCGFVTTAPTADPAESIDTMGYRAIGFKVTAPTGATKVTEIGWWCDTASEAADFDVGIYSHDAVNNRPDTLIGSSLNNPKGTSAGWKAITGLNITITSGTIYWIGVQLDYTETPTRNNFKDDVTQKFDWKTGQSSLPSPWGTSSDTYTGLLGFYAVYETGNIVTLAAAIAGVGALAAAPKVERKLSAAIAGSGGISAFAKVERKLAAAIAGVGGLAGSLSTGPPPAAGGTFASLCDDWLT